MHILHLLANYTPITNCILDKLKQEDKRRLFFSSTATQEILSPYPQMESLVTDATKTHITFYFPQITNSKNETKYRHRRNTINIPVNPLARKLQCKQCKVSYYNAKFEKEFQRCRDHNLYHYLKNNMIIRQRGQDQKGKYWTSQEIYQNNGNARALCYCDFCERFVFYTPIQTGTKTLTCLICTKYQHDIDKLLQFKQIQQLFINGREGFFIEPPAYQPTLA